MSIFTLILALVLGSLGISLLGEAFKIPMPLTLGISAVYGLLISALFGEVIF